MSSSIGKYWKAIVGFVTPGVVALVAAVQAQSPAGQTITVPEWIGIGAACIITGGVVYTVPNTKRPAVVDESPDADALIEESEPVEHLEDNTAPKESPKSA